MKKKEKLKIVTNKLLQSLVVNRALRVENLNFKIQLKELKELKAKEFIHIYAKGFLDGTK